nr:hypothetical protein [Tanacetum cinerariifolium]
RQLRGVIPEVGGIKASNDNPIPSYDPSISGTPPNLTPSGESDFFLEVAFGHCRDALSILIYIFDYHSLEVKENQEKDKIGSKPDKNGKRVEAEKSLKQLQLKDKKNRRKQKNNGRKRIHVSKVMQV